MKVSLISSFGNTLSFLFSQYKSITYPEACDALSLLDFSGEGLHACCKSAMILHTHIHTHTSCAQTHKKDKQAKPLHCECSTAYRNRQTSFSFRHHYWQTGFWGKITSNKCAPKGLGIHQSHCGSASYHKTRQSQVLFPGSDMGSWWPWPVMAPQAVWRNGTSTGKKKLSPNLTRGPRSRLP